MPIRIGSKPMTLITKFVLSGFVVFATPAFSGEGDWATVGGDPGHTKYSPLKQITTQNVSRLTKAWSYDAGGAEMTPVVIDGIMYYPSGGKVIALDGETGKLLWQTDLGTLIPATPENTTNAARAPGAGGSGRGAPPGNSKYLGLGQVAKYGVAWWPGNGGPPRIVVTTRGGYLLQFDAKTGALYKDFGNN